MKSISFLGKSTYEKINLMLYIARTASILNDASVCVVTNNDFFKSAINPREYIEKIEIFNFKDMIDLEQLSYSPYDYIFYDFENIIEAYENMETFVVSNQSKEIIDFNEVLLNSARSAPVQLNLILHDIMPSSKINERYLISVYSNIKLFKTITTNYFNEQDKVITIDNSHNSSLRIKSFSKEFKSFLVDIAKEIMDNDLSNPDYKKKIRILERS